MNSTKKLSNEEIAENYLNSIWFTIQEAKIAIQEKANEALLDKYRDALSLWEEHTRDTNSKVIITLDWRDTAWKWSNITRVTKDLKTSRFKSVAFPWVPSDEEKYRYNWFKRYLNEFPDDSEIIFFDRSWYNRAFVEAAMWFCTEDEYTWFMNYVNQFEKENIFDQWIDHIKVYLSITKEIQKKRLKLRERQRKKWKSSPIDAQAQEKWRYYTLAKLKALQLTDTAHAPWQVINSQERFLSAIEIMKLMIWTKPEVRKYVENDLGIDLKPDSNITKTAQQELKRMEKVGDLENIPSAFNFHSEPRDYPRQFELVFD